MIQKLKIIIRKIDIISKTVCLYLENLKKFFSERRPKKDLQMLLQKQGHFSHSVKFLPYFLFIGILCFFFVNEKLSVDNNTMPKKKMR